MNPINQNIIFDLPEETDLIDVIYAILEKNHIKDEPEKWLEREKNNQESQAVIMKHAAVVLFKKIAPDEKITQLLEKHLTVSQEIAKNIIQDIKLKLIPYMKLEALQNPLPTGVKPIETKSVEENAKANETSKKFTEDTKNILQNLNPKPIIPQNFEKKSDTYREPIE